MLIKKLVPVQKNNSPQSLLVPTNDMAKSPDNHRPLELVFVRHGESEGNVAVKAAERGDTSYFTPEFRKRHSSTWDLTKKGIQQAKAAGKWIRENINGGIFEGHYASTYRRAKRTAGYLNLPNARWNLRDYIREHDWGNLDVMTDEERQAKYPDIMEQRDINPYYFSAPGGESLADVLIRARVGILATLYRRLPNQRGIVVTHGNMIWPIRIIMEGLLPEEYLALKKKRSVFKTKSITAKSSTTPESTPPPLKLPKNSPGCGRFVPGTSTPNVTPGARSPTRNTPTKN